MLVIWTVPAAFLVVDSPAERGLHPDGAAFISEALTRVPLGRFAQPADVGVTVAFLASVGAGYITGQTISVSGGSVM